jgi:hypothetical protein
LQLLGGDVLYVNLFDSEFREKHKIPDFSKGRIAAPVKGIGNSQSVSTKPSSA